MSDRDGDVIDSLVGDVATRLRPLRAKRPAARDNAQRSYEALFAPDSVGDMSSDMSLAERHAVAAFVTALHGPSGTAALYARKLREGDAPAELVAAVETEAERGAASGPYGRYPAGPLSREDQDGPVLRVLDGSRRALGERLAAALEHAHMLVFHLRDAAPAHMRALEAAGWSATGIVTLSQLVAFLSFQLRVVAGLRVLADARTEDAA